MKELTKVTEPQLTPFERITRELNLVSWAFKCQFMEASTVVIETPLLHSKGRYFTGLYQIKSNDEIIKLQYYIQHYTQRFETTTNTALLTNELLQIKDKANNVLEFYKENLTGNSEIAKQFHSYRPKGFEDSIIYSEKHTGFIIVHNLNPHHIVFGKEKWNENFKYNYQTSNNELAIFCQKLIDFIDKFDLKKKSKKIKKEVNLLSELIRHELGEEIVAGIKIQYKNIKGKELKLLLLALQELKLLPEKGVGSKFHKLCKKEFDWNITSLTAMNKYNYNDNQDEEVKNEMIIFINNIINCTQ